MGAAFVICVVRARLLSIGVVLLTACSPQAGPSPPPSTSKSSASPSSTAQGDGTPLTLSAIQRLSPTVGYVAGWSGTGLAKTSDGGRTWQRLSIPADQLTALRFIDQRVGWVAGFVNRKGVVLRTQDGGKTWQTALAIATNGVAGDQVRQIQAVDAQQAWALTLDQTPCQSICPSNLQRTSDGGRTWKTQLHAEIAAMRFASASRGWVALDDTPSPGTVEVRETSDGGATWRMALRTATGNAMALDAATTDIAWLLTRDGAYCTSSNCERYGLFRRQDGGLSWSYLGNPKVFTAACSGGHLVGPLFGSATRGWLGLDPRAGGGDVGAGGGLQTGGGGPTLGRGPAPPQH